LIEGRRRLVAEFAFQFRDELDGQLQLLLSRLQLLLRDRQQLDEPFGVDASRAQIPR
jgi:hypothetical protein